MSETLPSNDELLAYLDEMLPLEQMVLVEKQLRNSESLRWRAAGLLRRRDQGQHSVGEIWRRLRLSCPSRSQLGGFVLGTLEAPFAEYIDFHVHTVGCRFCIANLADLQQAHDDGGETQRRRRKFFQSSAGRLQRDG